jgi:hypothetical protein
MDGNNSTTYSSRALTPCGKLFEQLPKSLVSTKEKVFFGSYILS